MRKAYVLATRRACTEPLGLNPDRCHRIVFGIVVLGLGVRWLVEPPSLFLVKSHGSSPIEAKKTLRSRESRTCAT